MEDHQILRFIYDRLINVHHESPYADYMIRLQGCLTTTWYGFKSTDGRWLVNIEGRRVVFESSEDANRAMPDYFVKGYTITPCPVPPASVVLGGGNL